MTVDEAARILGVEPGASADEVQRAYRLRARSSHPDGGGADERFIELVTARDALLAAPQRASSPVEVPLPPRRPIARWSWPLFWTWTALLALAIFLCAYLAPLPFTVAEPVVRFPLLAAGLLGYALTGRRGLLILGLVALGATAALGLVFTTIGILIGLLLMVPAVFGLVTLGQGTARRRGH